MAACDTRTIARWVNAAGIGVRYENSFAPRATRLNCTPQSCGPGRRVSQRAERDGHLHDPALVEPPGPRVPHGVPVAVRVALVGDEAVAQAAERRSTGTGARCGGRGTCRTAPRSCRSGRARTSRGASRWPRCDRVPCSSSARSRRRSCRRRAARPPSSAWRAALRGAPAGGSRRWPGRACRACSSRAPSIVIGSVTRVARTTTRPAPSRATVAAGVGNPSGRGAAGPPPSWAEQGPAARAASRSTQRL